MQNFQNTFETRKRLFISAFSIWMTVPLTSRKQRVNIGSYYIIWSDVKTDVPQDQF